MRAVRHAGPPRPDHRSAHGSGGRSRPGVRWGCLLVVAALVAGCSGGGGGSAGPDTGPTGVAGSNPSDRATGDPSGEPSDRQTSAFAEVLATLPARQLATDGVPALATAELDIGGQRLDPAVAARFDALAAELVAEIRRQPEVVAALVSTVPGPAPGAPDLASTVPGPAPAAPALGSRGASVPVQAQGDGVVGVLGQAVQTVVSLADQAATGSQLAKSAATGSGPGTGSAKIDMRVDATGTNRTAAVDISLESTGEGGVTSSLRVQAERSGPACPDESGQLVTDFKGEVTMGLGSVRSNVGFTARIAMEFDESGTMAKAETDRTFSVTATADGKGVFAEVAITRDGRSSLKRASQGVTGGERDAALLQRAEALVNFFLTAFVDMKRSHVSGGGCVDVKLEGPDWLAPGQERALKVTTVDALTGAPLDKRVTATLSGQGQLGTTELSSTPGELRYTAGDKPGDTGEIVAESRSRRGRGWGFITIRARASYRVQASNTGDVSISGRVCGLDNSFYISVNGSAQGDLHFVPTGPTGGTYSGNLSGGIATLDNSGTYQVDTSGETPVITFQGQAIIKGAPAEITVNGMFAGVRLTLVPDPTACPS